ncbi:DNA topoisomerase (ATP-hydrolyzing) subunit B [Candidatus Fokinia crypta]|uniref:DNA gyrase subunit B n=1 Tax=Candidatus Fokinia crypta TaxID=1920990 RepID=A0ABZ0UQL5_9RICK|nr:DNA topoisomerase (ATP-hydrolyzing) subunit B [Candidatus Fokinia cryptica]WPX97847.1 DNA gyrase subunit B [Candidatus Fokinia cryptica]
MTKKYDASSIQVLEGLDAVKKRPGMYIGDVSSSLGLHNMLNEVLDNAVDECIAGYAKNISISLNSDGSASVEDDGRGVPVDMHEEEGISAAEVIMTKLHAGGKFDSDAYKMSGGLHGVGVSVVNALSEWLLLTVWRDDNEYELLFKEGRTVNALKINATGAGKRGTKVTFLPSREIFAVVEFDCNHIEQRVRELAFLNPGASFTVKDYRKEEPLERTFCFAGGVKEFVAYLDRAKNKLHDVIDVHGQSDDVIVNVGLAWNDGYAENVMCFTNNIRQRDGGTHLAGFRSAITRAVTAYVNTIKNKKYEKLEVSPDDIREGLTAILSIKVHEPIFSSQTKEKLASGNVKGAVEHVVFSYIERWFEQNPNSAKAIANKILDSAIAREAARKARDLSRKKPGFEMSVLAGRLASCQEKNPSLCELFIVEGESAGGSAKQGRDRAIQAVLPLRGKVLNVERARIDKVLSHSEIGTLVSALGTGIGRDILDVSKLRYHKIILMTDADVDGAHIRTLLITFFFRYMYPIIEEGHLYIAEPPLYKVRKGQSDRYIKDERELKVFLMSIVSDDIFATLKGEVSREYIWERLESLSSFSEYINNRENVLYKRLAEICIFTDGFLDEESEDFNISVAQKIVKLWNQGWGIIKSTGAGQIQKSGNTKDSDISEESEEVEKVENFLSDGASEGTKTAISWAISEESKKVKFLLEEENRTAACEMDFVALKKDMKNSTIRHVLEFYSAVNFKIGGTFTIRGSAIRFLLPSSLFSCLLDIARKGMYIQRFKGLGEMNPEQLWETTLDPKNRILKRITVDDFIQADQTFSMLMGDVVGPRREFIEQDALNVKELDV